jgi:hypothetical protein
VWMERTDCGSGMGMGILGRGVARGTHSAGVLSADTERDLCRSSCVSGAGAPE